MGVDAGVLATTEVRWFASGDLPASVKEWWAAIGVAPRVQERTDVYLHLDRCITVGVKLREGALEVKARCEQGVFEVGLGVSGCLEWWRKWTSGPVDRARLLSGVDEVVVEVPKRRAQVGIEIQDGACARVPLEGMRDGAIELTELTRHGQAYWSLAVEVFSWKDTVTCGRCVRSVLEGFPWRECSKGKSMGYPEFLQGELDKQRET